MNTWIYEMVIIMTDYNLLRDRSRQAAATFKTLLETLEYDDTAGGLIGHSFSKKLSKLVFGFNDYSINQWNDATAEQLTGRILLLAKFTSNIHKGGYTKWTQLRDDMDKQGKKMWFYWNGSAGKRHIKGNLLEII